MKFHNKELLKLAFVHRSFWNENQGSAGEHNERLEFLGDSVLGLLIADYLFSKHPHLDEGSLSTLRSQLVDAPACSSYVQTPYRFISFIRQRGANESGEREGIDPCRSFRSPCRTLYLDQGLEAVRTFGFTRFA